MKKKSIIIVIVLLVISLGIYAALKLTTDIFNPAEKKESLDIQAEYSPSLFTAPMGDSLIIYDGKTLRRVSEDAKEIFSATIRLDNFKAAVAGDSVYLLDKVKKKVFLIDSSGEITAQAESEKYITDMQVFDSGRFALSYITDVKAQGIIVYDEKCRLIKDIVFPKTVINVIKEDSYTQGILVSGLSREKDTLKNNIFIYNKKMEAIQSVDIEGALITDAEFLNDKVVLMDIGSISIMNRDLTEIAKIYSEDNFYKMMIAENGIYAVDSKTKLSLFGFDGKLISQDKYESDIVFLQKKNSSIVCATKDILSINDERTELAGDIIGIDILEEKIALVQRGSIKLIKAELR